MELGCTPNLRRRAICRQDPYARSANLYGYLSAWRRTRAACAGMSRPGHSRRQPAGDNPPITGSHAAGLIANSSTAGAATNTTMCITGRSATLLIRAREIGLSPREYVAEQFGVEPPTVDRWIREAKSRDILERDWARTTPAPDPAEVELGMWLDEHGPAAKPPPHLRGPSCAVHEPRPPTSTETSPACKHPSPQLQTTTPPGTTEEKKPSWRARSPPRPRPRRPWPEAQPRDDSA